MSCFENGRRWVFLIGVFAGLWSLAQAAIEGEWNYFYLSVPESLWFVEDPGSTGVPYSTLVGGDEFEAGSVTFYADPTGAFGGDASGQMTLHSDGRTTLAIDGDTPFDLWRNHHEDLMAGTHWIADGESTPLIELGIAVRSPETLASEDLEGQWSGIRLGVPYAIRFTREGDEAMLEGAEAFAVDSLLIALAPSGVLSGSTSGTWATVGNDTLVTTIEGRITLFKVNASKTFAVAVEERSAESLDGAQKSLLFFIRRPRLIPDNTTTAGKWMVVDFRVPEKIDFRDPYGGYAAYGTENFAGSDDWIQITPFNQFHLLDRPYGEIRGLWSYSLVTGMFWAQVGEETPVDGFYDTSGEVLTLYDLSPGGGVDDERNYLGLTLMIQYERPLMLFAKSLFPEEVVLILPWDATLLEESADLSNWTGITPSDPRGHRAPLPAMPRFYRSEGP